MYEFLDRRYALALYEMCVEAGNVELVLQELKEIVDEMDSNKDLIKIIKNPQINKFNKKRIFRELFENSLEEELLDFLLLTIDKERILFLREKYNQFKQIYLSESKILIAEVKSLISLSKGEKEALKINLEKRYGKTIVLKEKVDKSLIGGIIVRIGDEIIDGSIKNRLVEFKKITNESSRKEYEQNNEDRRIIAKGIMMESLDDNCDKGIKNGSQGGYGREVMYAKITTAVLLTRDEKFGLISSLEKFYNKRIVIEEDIDKDIIGGIIVKIGNDITDYTIRDKLKYINKG